MPAKKTQADSGQHYLRSARQGPSRAIRTTDRFARLRSLIWAARRQAGHTLTEMARELHSGTTTTYNWEAGYSLPHGSQIPRLAAYMGISPEALQLLIVSEKIDRLFRRGAASLTELQRLAVATPEEAAHLRRSAA